MGNTTEYHVMSAAKLENQLYTAMSELMKIVRESNMDRGYSLMAEHAYEIALRKLGGLEYHLDTLLERI